MGSTISRLAIAEVPPTRILSEAVILDSLLNTNIKINIKGMHYILHSVLASSLQF